MEILQELKFRNSVVSVDWTYDPLTNELEMGVATFEGNFLHFKCGDWESNHRIEVKTPLPVIQVVGNHDPSQDAFSFALGTQEEGIFGMNLEKGITKRLNFRNSQGALAFTKILKGDSSLLISGDMDQALYGFNSITGKRIWKQKFQSGIVFVDAFNLDGESVLVAGDLVGDVRRLDAESGTLQWKTQFDYCTRFCLPTHEEGTRDKIWIAGTEGKKISIFRIRDFNPTPPITDIDCNDVPWLACRTSLASILVTTYNLVGITTVAPEGGDLGKSSIFCLSNLGNRLWETTIDGSGECLAVFSNDGVNGTDAFVSSNMGHLYRLDPVTGELKEELSFGTSGINCITLLPQTKEFGKILAVAYNDGLLRFLRFS